MGPPWVSVEVAEGEDGGEEHHHREHRLEQRQRDVPEAGIGARTIGLGRLVQLLRDGHQAREDGDGEERETAPDVDDDDRRHGVVPLAEPVRAGRIHEPGRDARPVHHAVERVEHPPPAERAERGGDHPRQEDRPADHALEPELLVEEQGQADPQHHLEHHCDPGEDERVLKGLAKGVAVPQVHEVAETDELARPADEGVGHREVQGHHEGIGDEQEQEEQGRGDEDRPQDLLAVEQPPGPGHQPRAPMWYRNLLRSDRHGRSPAG